VSRYVITPERSQVWIDARSNVHPIHSATDGLEGYVDIELSAEGGVNLSAPMTGQLSLSVDRLTSGNRMEDRELAKRIDARRFPTITGVLGTIETSDAAGAYKVAGEITFRGVTHQHADIMNITSVNEETIQLDGQSRFDIREFGMEPPRVLMLKVEPEVDIRVEIFAVRESGA
jgi:polyisoprenoid-binding protein YceI